MKIGDLVSLIYGKGEVGYITRIVNQDVYIVWLQAPQWGERVVNWASLKKISH